MPNIRLLKIDQKVICEPFSLLWSPLCHFFYNNSDKTDVESTHSSNISGYRHGNNGYIEKTAVIPPDALYATTTKKLPNRNSFYAPPMNTMHPQQQSPSSYAYDPSFNDSKVRIHTFSRKHLPINSSLNQHHIVSNHYVNTTGSSNQQNNGCYNWQQAVILVGCSTTRCQEQHMLGFDKNRSQF